MADSAAGCGQQDQSAPGGSTVAGKSPLAIAIVNHEHWPSVLTQLKSFHDQSPSLFSATEWIVVHNGDAEPVPFEKLDQDCPAAVAAVKLHIMENRGYGAAVNLAMSLSRAPYLLALNADMLPEPEFFAGAFRLATELQSQPRDSRRVAIVGFGLKNADGTRQGSVGRFPTLWRVLWGLMRPRRRRKYLRTRQDRLTEGPWTTGAGMLISRAFVDQCGGFDERFFMYYEDVDLCRRAWQLGWQVLIEPRLTLRHFEPYHSRRLTHRMVYVARHGLLRYFWKHRPRFEFRALAWIVRMECRLRGRTPEWDRLRSMVDRMLQDPDAVFILAADLPPK